MLLLLLLTYPRFFFFKILLDHFLSFPLLFFLLLLTYQIEQARGGGGRAGPKKAAGKGKGKRKAAPLNQQPQPKAPAAPAQICVPDNFSSVTLTSFLVELVENLVVLGSLPSSVVSSVPGLKAFLSTFVSLSSSLPLPPSLSYSTKRHVPKAVPTDVQPSPVSSLIQRIWGLLVLLPIILLGVEGLRKAHGEHEVAELVEGGQISLLLSQLAFVGSESCAIFEEVGTCVKVHLFFFFFFFFHLWSFDFHFLISFQRNLWRAKPLSCLLFFLC